MTFVANLVGTIIIPPESVEPPIACIDSIICSESEPKVLAISVTPITLMLAVMPFTV